MLRNRADIRTWGFISTYFGLLALAWALTPAGGAAWTSGDIWLGGISFILLCLLAFMGAVTTHNAIHCPIFRSKPLNKAFQVVLTLTYGHPVSSYVPGHNLSHHKHTQSRRDVMRTSKARFSWHLLNLLLFLPQVSRSIMRADAQYTMMMRKRHPRWFKQPSSSLFSRYRDRTCLRIRLAESHHLVAHSPPVCPVGHCDIQSTAARRV